MFVELKLRDDAPTELTRPLARQDFVNLGISSVNFEDRTQLQKRKMGKRASLARQLAGLPESAPQGL
jgi:hypothetical protein